MVAQSTIQLSRSPSGAVSRESEVEQMCFEWIVGDKKGQTQPTMWAVSVDLG